MNTVVIIQARMTSTRLPGKVLMEVGGEPMLRQQIKRLRQCKSVDEIVIATTFNSTDDPVVELAESENIPFFRGDEYDVLGRYVGAAKQSKADVVIRSTADCPFIDAEVTDAVIAELINNADKCDYASNTLERTFPQGLDVEAFFLDTLLRADRLGQSEAAREHVTVAIHSENPNLFVCRTVKDADDNSDLRLTVDTLADLELIRLIFDELMVGTKVISYRDIVDFLRANPKFIQINKGIKTWSPTVHQH